MTFINNVPEREHNPVNDVAVERDTDPLHQLLQDHIKKCDDCRKAIDTSKPRGFGQKSPMCVKYNNLVLMWSQGEYTRDSD